MSSDAGETSAVRTIGRYRAFDELGRGAMGVVYRGFDPVIGRTVALKTLLLDHADAQGQEFRERLYREAAAAGALSHPNIVTIFDIVEDGNTTAVAMEFIEGRSLAAVISERGPLPFDLAVGIFDQIASALDYAGSHGIVHRDIKPANILITPAGHVKITDFGVARLALSTMTQAGTVLGSPSYMSPEQVRGLPLDGRSDLFSAAVVFYEMVTRERPFAGNDVATTMYRIAHEPPTPPGHYNAAIGPMVAGVLDRALAKNPNDRYQSGGALAAELRQAAKLGPAEPAVPPPPPGIAAMATPPPAPRVPTPQATPIVMPPTMTAAPPPGPRPAGLGTAPPVAARAPVDTPESAVLTPLPRVVAPAPSNSPATEAEASGPRLAPIPMGGVAPATASASGAALPALPPGSVAMPAGSPPKAAASNRRLLLMAAGVAGVLLIVGGGTAGVLMMRSGGAAAPETPEPTEAVVAAPQAAEVPVVEPLPIPDPPPPPENPPTSARPPAGTAKDRPAKPGSASAPAPSRPSARTPAPAARTPGPAAAAPPPPVPRAEPARPASAPPPRVYSATEVDERPQVLKQAAPVYPEDALRRRIEDVVVLKVLVTADGRADDVQVLRGSAKSPSLDSAAMAAARRYQFSPARKGGQAVPCWLNLGVPFQLPRQ